MWVVDWKKLQMQACRLQSHTVDVTPPHATTKIMAGMAEQQTEWRNRMADGMVEWQEWRNGWMARMAGLSNGRMVKWREWLPTYSTIYGTHRHLVIYCCFGKCCWCWFLIPLAGMVEWQKEWQNGRMAEMDTYVLFMVHADTDTDDT